MRLACRLLPLGALLAALTLPAWAGFLRDSAYERWQALPTADPAATLDTLPYLPLAETGTTRVAFDRQSPLRTFADGPDGVAGLALPPRDGPRWLDLQTESFGPPTSQK